MKHFSKSIIIFGWLCLLAPNLFAQLQKYNLQSDPHRYKAVTNTHSGKRVMADTVLVNIAASISIISGDTTRCNSNQNPIVFTATGINGGPNPVFIWFVNSSNTGITGPTYTLASPSNNDQVYCQLNTNLACTRINSVFSNRITINTADTLVPEVKISLLQGNDTDCDGLTPVLLKANILNAGTNPNIQWYLNATPTGSNVDTLYLNTLTGRTAVTVTVRVQNGCPGLNSDSAGATYFRRITRIIVPTVNLVLTSIIADSSCTQPKYVFVANSNTTGPNPIYEWYRNGILVSTTTSNVFETVLPNTSDALNVRLIPSLSCVNPKSVTSVPFVRLDTLNLPFFDDFSNSESVPNRSRWLQNQGTYINNTYCIKPITPKVATFDGLKNTGTPYDTINITSRGITDRLTSIALNLSNRTNADSVGIHFLFQPGGNGEKPDIRQGDYLALSFLDSLGSWVEVWNTNEDSSYYFTSNYDKFLKKVVPINNDTLNKFLHKGFQFKFESFGRVSGSYDIWNLDYVFVGPNISQSVFFQDQSIGAAPGKIFNDYSAIPVSHLNANQSNIGFDTVITYLNNLDNNFNNLSLGASFTEGFYKQQSASVTVVPEGNIRIDALRQGVPLTSSFNELVRTPLPTPAEIWYSVFIASGGDVNNSDRRGINYQDNNTVTSAVFLDNFYAYDDGSAEYGLGMNYQFGQLAYKFTSYQPDTLRSIAINFVKLGIVPQNQSIVLSVWLDTLPNNPTNYTSVAYRRSVLLKYPTGIDHWTVYKLEKPIPITRTFYIGYQQFTDGIIAVGFDKNYDASSKIFYSIANSGGANNAFGWQTYSDSLNTGSLLMRPVFGDFRYVNAVQPSSELAENEEVIIYPNPATNEVRFSNPVQNVHVFNASGQMLFENIGLVNQLHVANIPRGLYLIRFSINGKFHTRRLLLE